ncbi:MAG: helix-turn-helix transcriptional regulator [Desulfosalsimonadaceae bacterium]|nr:MAG: XRE family transcriptional regulator [Desulfobacteraceae bacterium]
MSQTSKLLSTVKRILKSKGLTYEDISKEIGMSESSIKRLFSEHTFSLKRFEQICDLLEISFYELSKISLDIESTHSVMSYEQELILSEKPRLMIFFYLLLNGRAPDSIVRDYKISKQELVKYLLELDKLKLIELHPENKIRLLIQKSMTWLKNGPIAKKYDKWLKREFLKAEFDQADEQWQLEYGKLSDGSQQMILKKIDRLFREYYELTEMDKTLPLEKTHNTGLMIAFRPWVFSLIESYKR